MRRGSTFLEVCVAGGLLVLILGVLAFTASGARRGEALAALHLALLESVALAMHQLRSDLRQLSFVPEQPVLGSSIALGDGGRAVTLRRSSPNVGGSALGSSFVFVKYELVPAARPDRYHLKRTEYTASGANLPGKTRPREERLYRSFTLAAAGFLYQEDDARDVRLLHAELRVVSDAGPMGAWGPFREKELILTNTLSVLRPESASWGERVQVDAELPPADVVAPAPADGGLIQNS